MKKDVEPTNLVACTTFEVSGPGLCRCWPSQKRKITKNMRATRCHQAGLGILKRGSISVWRCNSLFCAAMRAEERGGKLARVSGDGERDGGGELEYGEVGRRSYCDIVWMSERRGRCEGKGLAKRVSLCSCHIGRRAMTNLNDTTNGLRPPGPIAFFAAH